MSDAEKQAWGDDLRNRYGIPYAVDMLTQSEEADADNLEDDDDTSY